MRSVIFVFDKTSVFEGFTVKYQLNDESKMIIISEVYRRLENVLDSLNLLKLKNLVKDQSFVINVKISDINDGDTIYISTLN